MSILRKSVMLADVDRLFHHYSSPISRVFHGSFYWSGKYHAMFMLVTFIENAQPSKKWFASIKTKKSVTINLSPVQPQHNFMSVFAFDEHLFELSDARVWWWDTKQIFFCRIKIHFHFNLIFITFWCTSQVQNKLSQQLYKKCLSLVRDYEVRNLHTEKWMCISKVSIFHCSISENASTLGCVVVMSEGTRRFVHGLVKH